MVVKIDLPRKLNFATDHAAATPNTTFNGTAIAAVSRVNFTADNVSWMYQCLEVDANPLFKGFYKYQNQRQH